MGIGSGLGSLQNYMDHTQRQNLIGQYLGQNIGLERIAKEAELARKENEEKQKRKLLLLLEE